jgi:hypothetical protein
MRDIVTEVPVTIIQESSGAVETTINSYHFTLSKSGVSETLNLLYKFPDTFDQDDSKAGLYRPRFFIENFPALQDFDIEYELSLTPDYAGPITGTSVPKVHQTSENFSKTTYYNTSNDSLNYLILQLASTSADTPTYDTRLKDRFKPRVLLDFERQSTVQLDYDHPNPNSDHLWDFSQVDLYIEWPVTIGGTTFTNRWLIGYCSDEDLTANLGEETVEFLKGKPMGRVVRFISSLNDMISGTISTMDPWFLKEGLHLFQTTANNEIVLTQKNVQRPIPNYSFTMEWFSNSGHLKRLIFPKGQLFVTGEMNPGGSDIARLPFELTPIVTENDVTYECHMTQSPIQRVKLPIGFDVS